MPSKRSQWCEFDKPTRKYIQKRDMDRCIYCGRTGALQIAHIFVSRAHGGKGDARNGVLLCVWCHNILDNPIGADACERSANIDKHCRKYLIRKEHIDDVDMLCKELIYDKVRDGKFGCYAL